MSGSAEDGNEILLEFVQESRESLQAAEPVFLSIERQVAAGGQVDRASVDQVFRLFHTMKGVAGFLGLERICGVTHVAESLLDLYRAGQARPSSDDISLILETTDALSRALDGIEATGTDAQEDARLRALAKRLEARVNQIRREEHGPAATDGPEPARQAEAAAGSPAQGGTTIRVDLEKLDALMNLVGELIIAETAVTHNPDVADKDLEHFQKAAVHLRRITRSLQDIAMSVRMVPLQRTFQRLVRLARDVSMSLGKKVDLVITGEATEVDKTVVEQLADPLVHILRNALDHGLETPDERVAAGKAPRGRIEVTAYQQGGEVVIRIKDDGRGLNRHKILERAIERGLVARTERPPSDREVYEMIYLPGFSTAEKVTDISGRGVGMDVVKRNIEGLGGRIDLDSELGRGTTLTIRIPLMLAIIDGMLVRVGDTTYTIPLLSIRENIRPRAQDVTRLASGQELVLIRDQLLPVVRLHELHRLRPDAQRMEDGILVVVEEHDQVIGLFADEVLGQQQTVIKGLGRYLDGLTGLAGCSVLGNGDISLILDVNSLLRKVSGGSPS